MSTLLSNLEDPQIYRKFIENSFEFRDADAMNLLHVTWKRGKFNKSQFVTKVYASAFMTATEHGADVADEIAVENLLNEYASAFED